MGDKALSAASARRINKNNIFRGTIILTLAGFITRVIGFFYKIFLSKTMGTEWLGIYQLVFPIYGICFTIFATGLQTAISRLVAGEMGRRNPKNTGRILVIGLFLSVSSALIISILIYMNAELIAGRFLLEPRSAPALKLLVAAFPFCGITSCINGYYYGLKKAAVPASTQLLEQAVRVIAVYALAMYTGKGDLKVTCEMAVIGLVLGEIASCGYNLLSLFTTKSPEKLLILGPDPGAQRISRKIILKDLLGMSIPLSANRLLINILHSLEAILIPSMLQRYGLGTSDSLSTFGVISGMSVPFIMFPTAVINALAVLILPTVSEAQALNNDRLIGRTAHVAIKYSLITGIASTGLFLVFGMDFGRLVFHNMKAGFYLMILSWLCPLIYLTTTLGSILNGLGKAHIIFINSVTGSGAKLVLMALLIPRTGVTGYFIALMAGQLIITAMDTISVIRYVRFPFDASASLLKPGIIVALTGFLIKRIYEYIQKITQINQALLLFLFCLLFCVICIVLFCITHTVVKKDIR